MNPNQRALLIILDGWGYGQRPEVDAIAQANTPFFDHLIDTYPNSRLTTFGEAVGLPEGQMGNSEVGHLNIGAGRVVYQELARINRAIKSGELKEKTKLQEALSYARENDKQVHLMGLVSDGGVHSHLNHLIALSDICADAGNDKVFIHAFTDGRDTAPTGGKGYLQTVLDQTAAQCGSRAPILASVVGRYYAMDRDKRWERVKLAYDLLVHGKGELTEHPLQTIEERYAAGETDEFLKPIVCAENGKPIATIQADDVVIFFNFRTDRPREITMALSQQAFPEQQMSPLDLYFVTMTRYDETFKNIHVLFEKEDIANTIGEVVSNAGLTQLRVAETEKYPHVTFFFSGGREEPFTGEDRILVPSPKVATYDLQPEMSALEVTEKTCLYLDAHQPNFVCLNYANADMVGHTGIFSAALKAAETVDRCLKQLMETALKNGYQAIVIADHGNSDMMKNPDNSPHTAHTMNPVPFVFVSEQTQGVKAHDGKLADIAPTILHLMGIDTPIEMDGDLLLTEE
jgi:2,3-bisphosphoglycerate-independent phosphoglycerate mutase